MIFLAFLFLKFRKLKSLQNNYNSELFSMGLSHQTLCYKPFSNFEKELSECDHLGDAVVLLNLWNESVVTN